MDTLGLAGAKNNVGERGAILEDEHGLILACLFLLLANRGYRSSRLATRNELVRQEPEKLTVTVETLHLAVELARDCDRL